MEPIINRVYSIEIANFDDSMSKVQALTDAFIKMDAEKKKLNASLQQKISDGGNTAEIEQLTKKIQALEKESENLAKNYKSVTKESEAITVSSKNTGNAYDLLVKSYKEAVLNAKGLSAEFGIGSEQAKAAAASAAEYKLQLDAINASIKNGGGAQVKTQVESASTITEAQKARPGDNLAELEAERLALQQNRDVITDLDKAEADAAMTANEWAASQKQVAETASETAATVPEITGSLDQYTGTLRQNILAQIENAQALETNKAEQKSIQQAIKEAGVATSGQTTRLAELKEQALILTETNKGLSVTIRNQAKEFIAGTGSIDELQAKVNQLQQAYEQLTEAERATPFGIEMKKELDILEPKVKELEGTIGKFQRNVGNYPNPFASALKTVETELETVQGKLISGKFSGKEFEQLSAQAKVLQNALSLTGKEFATVAQQQQAFKEAGTQIGLVYGKDNEVFKQFSSGVKEGNVGIKGLSTEMGTATKASGGLSKALTSGYNSLRKLAYLIPGLGISSLVLLAITPLESLGTAFVDLFRKLSLGKVTIAALNEVNVKAVDIYGEQKTKVEALTSVVTDNTVSLNARKAALDQLIALSPQYLEGLTLENAATKEGKSLIDAYILSLQRKGELEAAGAVNADATKAVADLKAERDALVELRKQGKVSFNDLTDAQKKFVDDWSTSVGRTRFTSSLFNLTINNSDLDQIIKNMDEGIKKAGLKVDAAGKIFKDKFTKAFTDDKTVPGIIQKLRDQIKNLTDIQPTLLTEDAIKTNVTQVKRLQDQLNQLLEKGKYDPTKQHLQSDHLADEFNKKGLVALAKFNQDELTLLKNKYKEEADDQNRSQEERTASLYKYYQVSKQIIADNTKSQIDALNLEVSQATKRAERLKNKQKEADALLAIENYRVAKLKEINQGSNVALQALDKQLFDEREKNFTAQMNTQIANAKAANKLIQDNPNATPGEKANSQVTEDNATIRAQVAFFLQMDGLQKAFNQNAKTNWEDFRRTLNTGLTNENNDALKAILAQLGDIDKATQDAIDKIQLKYDRLKSQVLTGKQSNSNKNNAVDLLNQTLAVETGGIEQNANVKKLVAAQQLYDFGLITTKQSKDIYDAAVKGQQDLNNAIDKAKDKITTVKGLVGKGIDKLFGFKKGSDEAKAVSDIIQQSFDVAGQAMNSYFDNEEQRIQRSLKLNQQRLDIEQKQAEDQAQSQAERDSLDRQFAAKKDALNKQAFEQDKKLKKQQLTMNFAIQLSNIAVAASANPFNAFTFGASGIAQYIIQAAIATGAYLINLSNINKSQYATGGKVTKLGNGKITVTPNIPTQSNGDNVLATVRTGEVILNEEQQRRAGGAPFFRSIGVPGFTDGGLIRAFASGGYAGIGSEELGGSLKAPVNPQSYLNPHHVNNFDIKKVMDAIDQQTSNINSLANQTNQRIDKLQVILNPLSVGKAIDKNKKSTSIGQL